MRKSATEMMSTGNRCILLMGPPKTGKTSLVASGSKFAPDTVKATGPLIKAKDVVLLNIDPEGYMGAVDSGYDVDVLDLSELKGYAQVVKQMNQYIEKIIPLARAGEINVVGLDLGALSYELLVWAAESSGTPGMNLGAPVTLGFKDVNWHKVSAQGLEIFHACRRIPCTVVAQTHVKLVQNESFAVKGDVKLGNDIISIGGTASKVSSDISKGLVTPWLHGSSMILARDIDSGQYVTHCSGSMFQTGNRRQNVMPAKTDWSLRKIIETFYAVPGDTQK